jgi:hypothetical protein
MLEPISTAAIDPIYSSPPVTSGRAASPPPWPKVESIIGIADTDDDPTQQVKDTTVLSLSILEHAQKWNLGSYPVDLLSETFEAFGKCIFSLKHRLDCIDTIVDSMSEVLESTQSAQVRCSFPIALCWWHCFVASRWRRKKRPEKCCVNDPGAANANITFEIAHSP